jgi:signal transduction histidine kinase
VASLVLASSLLRESKFSAVPPRNRAQIISFAVLLMALAGFIANAQAAPSATGAALRVEIVPPWWSTLWFGALCGVLFVLAVLAAYFYRVRQITKTLGARFDERIRSARELHDTLLQTIEGSKMVTDNALDQSIDPVQMRRAMEQLSVWLGQATKEGRAAMNSLRASRTVEKNVLAEAFQRATEDCRNETSMEASFSVIGDAKEVHPVVRDEIYRIGYEAIRNACTHSRGSRLDVALTYAQDLVVRVQDNGIGINSAIAVGGKDGHFGLQVMRERAARIGGTVSVASPSGFGTEVRIVVPGRIVFQNASANRFKKIRAIFRPTRPTSTSD